MGPVHVILIRNAAGHTHKRCYPCSCKGGNDWLGAQVALGRPQLRSGLGAGFGAYRASDQRSSVTYFRPCPCPCPCFWWFAS